MSDIDLEQRLRRELPALADALGSGIVAVEIDGSDGSRPSLSPSAPWVEIGSGPEREAFPARRSERTVWVLAAAAALLVAVMLVWRAGTDGTEGTELNLPAGPVSSLSADQNLPSATTTGRKQDSPSSTRERSTVTGAGHTMASAAWTADLGVDRDPSGPSTSNSSATASTPASPPTPAPTAPSPSAAVPPTAPAAPATVPASSTAASTRLVTTTGEPAVPTTRATTTTTRATTTTRVVVTPPLPLRVLNPGQLVVSAGSDVTIGISVEGGDGSAKQFSATGLPPGLSTSSSSGTISGRPTAPGVYSVQLRVVDRSATATQGFTLVVQ